MKTMNHLTTQLKDKIEDDFSLYDSVMDIVADRRHPNLFVHLHDAGLQIMELPGMSEYHNKGIDWYDLAEYFYLMNQPEE